MANSGIFWIDVTFDWCVNLLYLVARYLNITYEEINVWVFVITLPTILLISLASNLMLILSCRNKNIACFKEVGIV